MDLKIKQAIKSNGAAFIGSEIEFALAGYDQRDIDNTPMIWQEFISNELKLKAHQAFYDYACVSIGWQYLLFAIQHVNQTNQYKITKNHVIEAYNFLIAMFQAYETSEDRRVVRESNARFLELQTNRHPVFHVEMLDSLSNIDNFEFTRLLMEGSAWVVDAGKKAQERHMAETRRMTIGVALNTSHPGSKLNLALQLVR
jgi:hypothetical protein